MTSFENALTFLRSIKGCPASVLLALLIGGRAFTNRELQYWTGYSDEAVTQALRLLSGMGWISTLGPRGPWQLRRGRWPFSTGSIPEIPDSASARAPQPRPEISDMSPARVQPTVPEIPEPPPFSGSSYPDFPDDLPDSGDSFPEYPDSSSYSSSFIKDKESKEIKDQESIHQRKEQKKEMNQKQDSSDDDEIRENLHALHKAGVTDPKAQQLARLRHVNPAYIAAHVARARAQGLRLGTAIYRIQQGWPAEQEEADAPESVDHKIYRFKQGLPPPRRKRRLYQRRDNFDDGLLSASDRDAER